MPGKKCQYDEAKVEKIKTMLELFASRNQAQPYEIFVDKFKVVNKTTDTDIFDDYLNHIDRDTEELRIKVYNTDNSPRNDLYTFTIAAKPAATTETTLSGFEQMEQMVNEKLSAKDKEYEARRCQEKLEAVQEKLDDSEGYVAQLEEMVAKVKSNRYKLNHFNLVEFGSLLLQNLAEKNAHKLKGIGLGSLFDTTDSPAPGLPEPEGAAGFTKKPVAAVPNENHLRYIAFMEQLVSKFTEPQMAGVISILNHLMEHPEKVETVTQLLN